MSIERHLAEVERQVTAAKKAAGCKCEHKGEPCHCGKAVCETCLGRGWIKASTPYMLCWTCGGRGSWK